MKRSDDVFFFTLIDFLLQVTFFGLFLFVVGQAIKSESEKTREQQAEEAAKLLEATGISSIAELTDLLTKMVPLDKLRGTADFLARTGGDAALQDLLKAAEAAGGAEQLAKLSEENTALSERVAKLEGWAKPSCLPNVVIDGKLQPKVIATAVVEDNRITIESPQSEFNELLARHGLEFAAVQTLTLERFRATFAPVVASQPSCRYFLTLRRETKYFDPMRTLWSVFRTN
jgi:hypothetical protein